MLLTRDANSDDLWGPCIDVRGSIGNPGRGYGSYRLTVRGKTEPPTRIELGEGYGRSLARVLRCAAAFAAAFVPALECLAQARAALQSARVAALAIGARRQLWPILAALARHGGNRAVGHRRRQREW